VPLRVTVWDVALVPVTVTVELAAPIAVGSNTKLDPTETVVLPLLMVPLWPPPLKSPVALPQVRMSPALPRRSFAVSFHDEDDWPT